MSSKKENLPEMIEKFYSLPLQEKELAFIYFGYAGILFRTRNGSVGIDLALGVDVEVIDAIPELDLFLITHKHYDHFNKKIVMRIFEKTTATIIAEPIVAGELAKKIPPDRLIFGEPGEKRQTDFKIGNVTVTAAMGVHPCPITVYKIKWDNLTVFHAGDSGYMALGQHKAHVAFLPIGRPSPTCAPEIALAMAKWLKAKVVVGMHGGAKQMKEFTELMAEKLPKTEVVIPQKFSMTKLSL
ncbi:MAG: MBL fold metallo-hydrolase [Candidatus Thorarchaeota archaeon]|jgi:L-ascorbate metabolism protein UlaG (beta-lactamase superfamily)